MDGSHTQARRSLRALTLVIPAYNEGAGIGQAVAEAEEALSRLCADYEIIVVDDGSSDDTAEVVTAITGGHRHIRLIRHEGNRGYGAALRSGFEAARHERVAFTDADCQFHLDDLAPLLELTEENDLAVGYRIDRRDIWRRRFFSWGYNALVRTLLGTGVRDCDCALKVYRRDVLGDILPQTNGFFVNTEMLTRARQNGYRVAELGVRHRPRLHGESKVSLHEIPRTLATLLPFWWSEIMFPRSATPEREPGANRGGSAFGLLAVSLLAALLFFSRLSLPLQEPEESRYAEIPRQMLEAGEFSAPVLNGLPYNDKPPLLYWLVMGSYRLFGVDDWAARLVAGACGFLCVLCTYFWGRQTVGPRPGLLAALILCLSPRFVYLARLLTMNTLLCMFVTASLACAHRALLGRRLQFKWWVLSASACGLGLLAKGPVALVLILVPVLAALALDHRLTWPSKKDWSIYALVALGLAAPWYLAMAARDPEFLSYFFWKQNVVRYVVPFDHEKSPWFFVGQLALGMLPWSLLLLPFVKYLFSRHPEREPRPAALGVFLLASLGTLAFFSVGGSKRAGYILPALPPLALVLGCYLDSVLVRIGHSWLWIGGRAPIRRWAIGTAALILAVVSLNLPLYARHFALRRQIRPFAKLAAERQVAVVCYPRMWDSVSFYLQRSDVAVYREGELQRLVDDLCARPETIAFIKGGTALSQLPKTLEIVGENRRGDFEIALIRQRRQPAGATYAQR